MPNVITYSTLLTKAHTLADMSNDGIKPDLFTYTTLLNKAHTLSEGRTILTDIRNDGFTPDAHTYSSLPKLSSDVNDVELVLPALLARGQRDFDFRHRSPCAVIPRSLAAGIGAGRAMQIYWKFQIAEMRAVKICALGQNRVSCTH